MRLLGLAMGLGFIALGAFALLGGPDLVPGTGSGRASGLGVTLVIAGALAIVASLTVPDPHRIW
jgi:hypothetical protein